MVSAQKCNDNLIDWQTEQAFKLHDTYLIFMDIGKTFGRGAVKILDEAPLGLLGMGNFLLYLSFIKLICPNNNTSYEYKCPLNKRFRAFLETLFLHSGYKICLSHTSL